MPRGLVASLLLLLATASRAAVGGAGQPALYPDHDLDIGLRPLRAMALSPDGRLLAAGGADGSVTVWDTQAARQLRQHAPTGTSVTRLAFDAAGTVLAVGEDSGAVRILDLRTGEARVVMRHGKAVTALAFGGPGLAGSGDAGGDVALWDPLRGAPLARLRDEGHSKPIVLVGFAAGPTVITVGRDLKVIAWDAGSKRPLRRGTLQSENFGRAVEAWAADLDASGAAAAIGAQLVTATHRAFFGSGASPNDLKRANVMLPYAVTTGMAAEPVHTGEARAEALALSPGGCFAFLAGAARGGHELHLWALSANGQSLHRAPLPARAVSIGLDAAGRRLAVGLESGRALLWTLSGLTLADCQAALGRGTAGGTARVALGAETEPLIPAGANLRIAVLAFEAGGVEPHVAEAVREMVAGELANSAHVQVVERAAIDGILREMEIQRSGLTAADAARIGRGLNARKVLFGSVRRFGDRTYVVLARVVDVETQQVQGSRQVSCESCAEGDLLKAVQALRQAIVP